MPWLRPSDLRVGLGCMRLSTTGDRNQTHATNVINAALDAGVSLFDTAHSYALNDDDLGHNERWLGQALAQHRRGADALVVTKGGMRRPAGRWVPDGRAVTLRAHCEASRLALGRPIDLYLLHAPDSRTDFLTSCRALASLQAQGLVRAVGLSNVSVGQLRQALDLMPVAAVQVGVSLLDDAALRGGVVHEALLSDLTVLCHSPLGGPKHIGQLVRTPWLVDAAHAAGCTPHEWALAALLALDPRMAVLPGCRQEATVLSAVRAAKLKLPEAAIAVLRASVRPAMARPLAFQQPSANTWVERPGPEGRVVLLMGIQGAGKSMHAALAVANGALRLNRDEAGGTLAQLHQRLDQHLTDGHRFAVLDNTYVTRAQRQEVLAMASRHGVPAVGLWHDIEVEQAHINIVLRQLAVHQRLLSPEEMAKSKSPDGLPPLAVARTVKSVEVPDAAEGFSLLHSLPFIRRPWPVGQAATFFGLDVQPCEVPGLRFMVGSAGSGVPSAVEGVEYLVCPHGDGPPRCWCRPPLPGLLLLAAHRHQLNLSRCTLVSRSPALQRMALALGLTSVLDDVSSLMQQAAKQATS